MARNKGGRRAGAIRGRTQFRLPDGHYAKRDRRTGEILSIKADTKPYKNVIIERTPDPANDQVDDIAATQTAPIVQLPFARAA